MRNKSFALMTSICVLGLAGFAPLSAAPAGDLCQEVAMVTTDLAGILVQPLVAYDEVTITFVGPDGIQHREVFFSGETPAVAFVDSEGYALADGGYNYEVVVTPRLSDEMLAAMDAARANGDEASLAGLLPEGPQAQTGFFRLEGGAPVNSALSEDQDLQNVSAPLQNVTAADQVILDDLIVDGSACIGLDCVNGESFGFDTLRLKENNLRIKFLDTSASASFPSNDWELTANDSANGGQNKFSITDITGGRTPFTIEAPAPSNSLYVDDGGRIGIGTATPVVELHVVNGDSPTLRLEQNGSSGFAPQTWDVAGNETNYFIRDVSNGSTLPFRIRPSAPTSSIDIAGDGDVGIGTTSPDARIHVVGGDGVLIDPDGDGGGGDGAALQVRRTAGALATLMRLTNDSGVQFLLDRTDGQNDWQISNFGAAFEISVPGSVPSQMQINTAGDMTIGGTNYNTGSSRGLKENFTEIDPVDILRRVVEMPLTEWSPKTQPEIRHIGPVAEEWWEIFGLGTDNKHVGVTDVGGVTLAAIKGLNAKVEQLESENANLRAELAGRLAALEQMLADAAEGSDLE